MPDSEKGPLGRLKDTLCTTLIGKLWLAAFVLGLAGAASASTWSNINTYPVPTAGSAPYGIAAGPDGALWFTEYSINKIGRITTAGVISEFHGNNIARAPACGVGLSASFANGTLTMNFNLGIDTAAIWYADRRTSGGGGEVGIVSGSETAAGEGLCYETVNVNTAR